MNFFFCDGKKLKKYVNDIKEMIVLFIVMVI